MQASTCAAPMLVIGRTRTHLGDQTLLSTAVTCCTVHAADAPPFTLTPIPMPETVESKPPEVVITA